MRRVVMPELLDSLPASHPDAVASRRDLRRINGIMGNFAWLERQLAMRVTVPGGMILEIGAGDGGFARRVCAARPPLAVCYHALDLAPCPEEWPPGATWHQADLWSEAAAALLSGADIVVANLFLHHFESAELRRLGHLLQRCRCVLVSEPSRRARHIWQGRLLFPFLNRVTRHDMIVSIRAGFCGHELCEHLGLSYAEGLSGPGESFFGAYRTVLRGSLYNTKS